MAGAWAARRLYTQTCVLGSLLQREGAKIRLPKSSPISLAARLFGASWSLCRDFPILENVTLGGRQVDAA